MSDTASTTSYKLNVEGMTCQHCVGRVETALKAVDNIIHFDVSLENNRVTITGGIPHQAIAALNEAGYPATPFQSESTACAIPAVVPTKEEDIFIATENSYRIKVDDMTCASCITRVENSILSVKNVRQASINLIEGIAQVNGGNPDDVIHAIIDSGYPAHAISTHSKTPLRFVIDTQTRNKNRLETLLKSLDQNLSLTEHAKGVFTIDTTAHPAAILSLLSNNKIQASCLPDEDNDLENQTQETDQEIKLSFKRAMLAGSIGAVLMLLSMTGILPSFDSNTTARLLWVAIAIACLFTLYFSGKQYYVGAWKQLQHGSSNMDTLIALGTGAAWLASVLLLIWPDLIPGKKHLYLETSVIILAFLQIGHALEIRAKNKTRQAIRSLIDLSPETATVIWEDNDYLLPLNALQVGDQLHIRPGERIPIDSHILSGKSVVDESMLTGESIPVMKQTGDVVTGGTINGNGVLIARVTQTLNNTTLANIIERVKQAQASKPPIGRLVDKVASVFVPIVLIIAAITFVAWLLLGPEPQGGFALTTAIAVLVIACPCALGLATPIAIMIGSGRAAQSGILIRNGDALQAASEITHLVVDKTGTLTKGKPVVTTIHAIDGDENHLLKIAGSLEKHSEHPLASAISEAVDARDISLEETGEFTAITGLGVQAVINHETYRLGNKRMMEHAGIHIDTIPSQASGTQVYLANSTHLLGALTLQDPLRSDSKQAVKHLQNAGIAVILCTGDNRKTAEAVATELGITQVHSEALPADKAALIESLQNQGYKVAMAGDGINDAPALAQANVSFAIGTGSEVAIENGDITLASNSLQSITDAIEISKATIRNIKQNLVGAFGYNIIGIPLAAGVFYPLTGWLLSPMFASAAMALSSVTVVSNANRLRFLKTGAISMSGTTTLSIAGMTCQHCVKSTIEALEKVDGVDSVEVTLEPGRAIITGSATENELTDAVKAAGYEVTIDD